jgi:alpha-glucosidase
MAFEKGDYLRQTLSCKSGPGGNLALSFAPRQGRYAPWWNRIEIVVHAQSGRSRIGSTTVPVRAFDRSTSGTLRFAIPDVPGGASIRIEEAAK